MLQILFISKSHTTTSSFVSRLSISEVLTQITTSIYVCMLFRVPYVTACNNLRYWENILPTHISPTNV